MLRSSYSTFFSDSFLSNSSKNQQIYITHGSYFLTFCIFNFFHSLTSGCVFFSSSNNLNMVLENSIFNHCTSQSYGGAISFRCSTNGGSAITKVCSFNCSASDTSLDFGGLFSFTHTTSSKINHYSLISVSFSGFSIFGSNTIALHSGKQQIININSSNNYGYWCSGLYCFNQYTSNCNYSTFINNNCNSICVASRYDNGASLLFNSNIVNNTIINYGIIYNCGTSYIISSYFNLNKNYLFTSVTQGTMYIINCYINHLFVITRLEGGAISMGTTFSLINTFPLDDFSSKFCSNLNFKTSKKNNKLKFFFLFNLLIL